MATRHVRSSAGSRFRRRWAVFSLAALTLGGTAIWLAPAVLVLTHLRDRPLQMLFAGIDGSVLSGGASWNWLGGSEYRNVTLLDRNGRPVAAVQRVVIERGLVALALDPTQLGTVRLIGATALVEVRRGGSTLEDILAPWLATRASAPPQAPVSFEIELVDAAVELVDLERRDAWQITELLAAGTVRPDARLAGWTVSGRVLHSGQPAADLMAAFTHTVPTKTAEHGRGMQLDRTTIAAGATAMLTRDGGWSVSSPAAPVPTLPRTLAIATNRLPLGISSVVATRFDTEHLLDGLADVRVDILLPLTAADTGSQGTGRPRATGNESLQISGVISGLQLALCHADTLAEIASIARCEIPLDISLTRQLLTVRHLKATSPLFTAEASGRIQIPQGNSWDWAEALIGEDFALAADIDLAAASRAIPGGLSVRPDVRVTAGQLQLAAAAHADGGDRLLEVRVTSRDLAAVQSVAATAAGGSGDDATPAIAAHERLLRWNEPFTAWLRGRRGPARSDSLHIEEARIASPAVEVLATGHAGSASLQWTVDIDKLIQEAAEVLDLESLTMAGMARGKIDIGRSVANGAQTAKISASLANFALLAPGRPAWRDKEITLEAEVCGSLAGGAVLVDQAHAKVLSADDSLELTLNGGTLIDLWAGLGSPAAGAANYTPWVRAAQDSQGITADCSLAGDLARWQARLMGIYPLATAGDLALAGKLQLSASLTARGDSWQIERAGGEIEKLVATFAGRQISEPRLVVSAAGLLHPATGRLEISSAEILTATVSLRSGGAALLGTDTSPSASAGDSLIDRLRGKVQWQADVGRLEKWIVSPLAAASWPAGGRAWGTLEILDTPTGLNLLLEATGNQLSLSSVPDSVPTRSAAATPQPVWTEPRARLILEVTRGGAAPVASERLTINKLALESSTVALTASGGVSEWSSRRLVDLSGTLVYDWELLSRLLTPWTGGRVRLAGGGARPFALRGPLRTAAQDLVNSQRGPQSTAPLEVAGPGAGTGAIALPDNWLATARGNPALADTSEQTRVWLPVATAVRPQDSAANWLRCLSVDTSTAWSAAEVEGVQVEAGEMAVRLFEGQLALGPFDLGVSGGRVRGAPWLRLLPAPAELIVPPGRMVDRVAVSKWFCDRWLAWIVPLIGHSTRTEGVMSVDLAGARLPLGDFFAGEMSGQVLFEKFEVTPGSQSQPFVNLLIKLQSLVDPRFAFGDKTVLLRVRPEPLRIKLADRRLWHDGLVMEMGQLLVRTAGSVGADESLAMVVEVSLRGDIAAATPVVGQLLRTPLAIPLRGTVSRPQFDAGSIDTILGRIVENTAQAVINDGIGRGLNNLEGLFGNPQPPPAPLNK